MFKNAGEPNILDNNLIKKAKYVAIGMRAAGGGINMSWIPNITVGVVKAKNSSSLREFGGTLQFKDWWTRDLLHYIEWKGKTGKIAPLLQFLFKEKFTLQTTISAALLERDIPTSLIVNLDQTSFSYVIPGKCTFSFRGAEDVPIKRVDDKRQIT